MKLLVVILCLLSERYLVHAISLKRFSWFPCYFNALCQRLPQVKKQPIVLLLVVLPLLILTGLVLWIFNNFLFGFVSFLLNLVIFYYCLGPDNPFYPHRETAEMADEEAAAANYFVKVNGQLFAVVFWYITLGAVGALAYRLISLCRNESATTQLALKLTNLLDWIPARITVLLFLLVGNFQRGFQLLSQKFFTSPESNSMLLSEGGLLAARSTDPVSMPYAESLVEHAMIVYLVFLALFTLGALM